MNRPLECNLADLHDEGDERRALRGDIRTDLRQFMSGIGEDIKAPNHGPTQRRLPFQSSQKRGELWSYGHVNTLSTELA